VADVELVVVPIEGDVPVPPPAGTEGGSGTGAATGGGAADPARASASALVDLNSADAAALDALPGIGPVLAQRVVDHRERTGPFSSVDELVSVSGIGPAVLADIRDLVTV
jgi:competence protein ComEA